MTRKADAAEIRDRLAVIRAENQVSVHPSVPARGSRLNVYCAATPGRWFGCSQRSMRRCSMMIKHIHTQCQRARSLSWTRF